jgi:hypothetical protein
MPFVKHVNTRAAERALDELRDVGQECATLAASLQDAQRRRDALARKASKLGATRREVAQAASVTAGRVQQILDRR